MKKLTMISLCLMTSLLLQGCRFFDIKENVINDALIKKTGAFESTELITTQDKIVGFAFDPTDENLLIITEKYLLVSPMSDELKFILKTDYIRDNILPNESSYTPKTYASVLYEHASIKGVAMNPPQLAEMEMIMCFQNILATDEQVKIENEIEQFQSFKVSYVGTRTKPCFLLFLTKKGGHALPINEAPNVPNYTELKKPIYYTFTIRMLKDPDELARQNAIARGLSPITTVLDRTYEFAQFIALPITNLAK
ncbi:hypothetical protein [Thorsellia anophelis]|uniref:Lipoprotein n=1 Tax=Thorsellia anophelis DSM 18579 TaxID=1123402 RepID=A0A1I0DXR5_9GAMM|nr:hypothetical protein [Thorsellia anophelis]SET37032.1 hypothetical protein SAMN02583745_02164 [Thorsellia anophelis DSM 18579]